VDGPAALHALIADHLAEDAEPGEVVVGIETDRGPWVAALIAAGYTVYAVNPLQVARYRERHGTAGGKSDPGDAHVLAELVRLDRAHHRPVAGDSATAEHVRVLTRTHQSLICSRQRQTNALRSMLRECYPGALAAFGADLAGRDALAILAIAPTPEAGAGSPRARSPRCAGPGGSATSRSPRNASRPRCAPRSWRPVPAWWRPTPPRCARWSP
jgi:transposase